MVHSRLAEVGFQGIEGLTTVVVLGTNDVGRLGEKTPAAPRWRPPRTRRRNRLRQTTPRSDTCRSSSAKNPNHRKLCKVWVEDVDLCALPAGGRRGDEKNLKNILANRSERTRPPRVARTGTCLSPSSSSALVRSPSRSNTGAVVANVQRNEIAKENKLVSWVHKTQGNERNHELL